MLNVPSGITAAGKLSLTVVPRAGIANLDAITATEVNAVGAVNVSCVLQGDGYGRSTSESTGTGRRACEEYEYDIPGTKKTEFDQTRFVYDPQDPIAAVSIAYAALTEGEEYVLIERFGISGKQELVTGDIYSAYPVRLSIKEGLVPGGEGELEFYAQFRSTGSPARDKAIVAAV
ncbi:hypothetical protein [Janibacter terrae]|uniref:phage tail tube protein n=1 Tax=Janibacter terrae TaxID=103817 RepID=UPI0031F90C87